MMSKTADNMPKYTADFDFFRTLPATPKKYINVNPEKKVGVLADMMLADQGLLYVGGAGSCAGCGEATAIRMMLAATGFVYGQQNIGIVACDRLQHGLHLDLPVQPVHDPLDQLAVRERPGRRDGRPPPLGPAGLEEQTPVADRRRRAP